jgi:hypothetical protein
MVEGMPLKTKVRLLQAFMLGVFMLGVSMTMGDLTGYWKIPISPFSMTTMIFGIGGALVCEAFVRTIE